MKIVAGLSLVNLKPQVWDATLPYHLPELDAVMVSYSDFHQSPTRRRRAIVEGLHASLGIPKHVKIYLDNGAFRFSRAGGEVPRQDYEAFVEQTQPDWYAIPQDYIPTPRMDDDEQLDCLQRTMAVNKGYSHDEYVPILHISRHLDEYLRQFEENEQLRSKPIYAIGGIVPNLLRALKAMGYQEVLDKVRQVRETFANRELHLFGVGGTATLHVAALLGVDSVDSSGWRVRAARGLVQLPGIGDRTVANLGNWRVREPNPEELKKLKECQCPACQKYGIEGLKADRLYGACNRPTHNLWTLLEENRMIQEHLANKTYAEWYKEHLHNSTYRPLIDKLVETCNTLK
jgi:7-cyano-7-deazaguanine tRNA-ribosyltransferase